MFLRRWPESFASIKGVKLARRRLQSPDIWLAANHDPLGRPAMVLSGTVSPAMPGAQHFTDFKPTEKSPNTGNHRGNTNWRGA